MIVRKNKIKVFELEFIDLTENYYIQIPDFRILEINLTALKLDTQFSISLFKEISNEIKKSLRLENTIIFYICDNSEVKRRDLDISPQKFRFDLFNALFGRYSNENIIKESYVLELPENNKQYVTAMAMKENEKELSSFISQINDMGK